METFRNRNVFKNLSFLGKKVVFKSCSFRHRSVLSLKYRSIFKFQLLPSLPLCSGAKLSQSGAEQRMCVFTIQRQLMTIEFPLFNINIVGTTGCCRSVQSFLGHMLNLKEGGGDFWMIHWPHKQTCAWPSFHPLTPNSLCYKINLWYRNITLTDQHSRWNFSDNI